MDEVTRSAAVIAAEINAIKSQTYGILEAAHTYAKRSCFEIGKRLEEAKATVPHGEWGDWLEANVSYSVSTANDLMRIYREFGDEQIDMLTGKSDAEVFEGLSQSQMVALFGLPKADRVAFVEEHRAELESGELSTRKLKEEIKRLNEVMAEKDRVMADDEAAYDRLEKDKKTVEDELRKARVEINKAHDRITEMESRFDELSAKPIEATAVEKVYEPTPEQVEEIRSAAIKETEDKLQKAADKKQKELDKLLSADLEKKKEIDDLKGQLEAKEAEMDGAIKSAVAEAVAGAEKKMRALTAQSDPRAAKVSYCLEAIGRAMADINGVIVAMNGEKSGSGDNLRGKCEAAMLRLFNTYGWQI